MSEEFWLNYDQINISHRRQTDVLSEQLIYELDKMLQSGDMTKRAEKWPVLMMTSSAEHHPRRFGYSHRQNYKNKTFKKRKNRALLTLRRSQKHYEIFSTTFCEKKITRKQLRLETIEIA